MMVTLTQPSYLGVNPSVRVMVTGEVPDVQDMGKSGEAELITISVENDRGETAKFFVDLGICRGRARLKVTSKKHRGKETIHYSTADWRL